ncbi:MAG TPA: C13 family peptidase [Geobacteraceae bacterium]|nr:C13 family peptidase [Geobacteraceae bacterium]
MNMDYRNSAGRHDIADDPDKQSSGHGASHDVPPADGEAGAVAASPGEGKGTWSGLLRNLRGGVRLALFLRARDDFRANAGDLIVLAAIDPVFNLILSLLLVGTDGTPNYSAIPSFFFHLPLMLLCGLVAGRLLARRELTVIIPTALIALSIPIELCHGILEGLSRLPRLARLETYLEAPHYYRFFWWWTTAAIIFLLRLGPARLSRRLLLVVVFAASITIPLALFPRGDLWISGEEGNEGGGLHLTEEVLSDQSHLLDGELDGLLPGRRDVANLYFIGFAGDAGQDVFTRELTAVGRLFAERFGAAGRSILLANNPRTATNLPFATATNLETALVRIGRVMNRDNDVLFLFLTSHGSPDHVLTVDNTPLELDGLTPEMVRKMFRKSGITWKVLVVSACYAGGFIEPLKDDRTLIITAADATHESFGCSFGEEYTWFGKAYFDQALRGTYSFTDAFARARKTIGEWETERGEIPSNPQMWMGREMAVKLAQLENRLKNRDSRPRANH